MVDLIVFKTIRINSQKGRYNVFFKNNLNNIIMDFDFKNSHLIIDKKVFSIYENSPKNLPLLVITSFKIMYSKVSFPA